MRLRTLNSIKYISYVYIAVYGSLLLTTIRSDGPYYLEILLSILISSTILYRDGVHMYLKGDKFWISYYNIMLLVNLLMVILLFYYSNKESAFVLIILYLATLGTSSINRKVSNKEGNDKFTKFLIKKSLIILLLLNIVIAISRIIYNNI